MSPHAVRCSSCQFDYRDERSKKAAKDRLRRQKEAKAAEAPRVLPPVRDRVREFYERQRHDR
jgi:hypothetical protein